MRKQYYDRIEKFHKWRQDKLSTKAFVTILSILVGLLAGLAAVVIKNSVHLIQSLIHRFESGDEYNLVYVVLPIIGISLAVIFIKFFLRKPVRHGIPNVLYSISKRKGYISRHNLFSSIVTSALTVGFGGSVGLEGPTVSTGAAIGSQMSKYFRLEYKYIMLLLACACSASMAAIFKAPIAAIVFAVEVIMIDLTTFSLIPLLLASSTAVLVSYLFLGMEVLYPFDVDTKFSVGDFPFYVVLGIVSGFVSVYFTKMYKWVERLFDGIKKFQYKLFFGALTLGGIIFVFPSLYGEGYESINSCLSGESDYLFDNSLFVSLKDNLWAILGLTLLVILFKVVATSATFGAGGVGGIFAPTLFTGVNTGMLFALFSKNVLGFQNIDERNFALIGMGGLIAGVLHAPLTGIFLIADISGGYGLFVPLMIAATFSYLTVKFFTPNSVYTMQLAKRKQLVTHHKDKHALSMMEVRELTEKDFVILDPDSSLRDLVNAIAISHRNLFPIVNSDGILVGMLKMDDVRHLIFKQDVYDKILLKEIMYMPEHCITTRDSMDEVVEKFESSGRYNMAVVDHGKYKGFISRAKVFSKYRSHIKDFSHD